ncbi:2072_t:CDS:10, partial [Funneliformis geosporum]
DTEPDHKLARKWEAERSRKQIYLHQPTIMEIGTASGTVNNGIISGTVNNGTISCGTFDAKFSSKRTNENEDDHEELQNKRTRMDGENPQPIFHVQIPPPRIVAPPPRTPEHQIFSSDSFVLSTTCEGDETDSDDNFDADTNDNPGENISELFISYRSKVLQMAQATGLSIATDYREILSLSHILLLQADNFSDLQVQEFSRDTLERLQKSTRNAYAKKTKVAPSVKAVFRGYIETILDEDLGLKEAKKAVIRTFAKSFEDPADQEKFDRMQIVFLQLMENIPISPLNDLISEGTLTVNIISPILRSFFHDATIHPTTWPNTASMSAKARKLANLDPSRAKQPDMVGKIVNNKKSKYEFMFGEITGEGKNNNMKKNNLDLIRLGIFMKDALDLLIKNTRKDHMVFAWQAIVTLWTGYVMVLTASGLYIMIDIGQIDLPKSFQNCGQFIDNIDKLFTFTEKYKYEVQMLRDDINKKKKDADIPVEIINWCRATLGTPQFKEIIKKLKYLGPPSKTRRPDFLKTLEHPKGLELDIPYYDHGFAIEVQGVQHEKYHEFFHKGNLNNFIKQQERDQLKKKLCEENDIYLFHIWYNDKDPEKIIQQELCVLGLIN